MRRGLTALGLITACALGAGLGAYAGTQRPAPDPVTVVVPSWADGCSSDADCAAMDRIVQDAVTSSAADAAAEGESPWDEAWLNVDCLPPDEDGEYPCLVAGQTFPVTGPDGVVHYECVAVLTTAETSEAVCPDDTVWPS